MADTTKPDDRAYSDIAKRWLEKDKWRLEDGVCLFFGFNPEELNGLLAEWLESADNPDRDITLAKAVRAALDDARQADLTQSPDEEVAPLDFLRWARDHLAGGLHRVFEVALWREDGQPHQYLDDYLIIDKPLGTGPIRDERAIWLVFMGDRSKDTRLLKVPETPFEISRPDWDFWTNKKSLWHVSEAARLVFGISPVGITTPTNMAGIVTSGSLKSPLWPPEAVDLELYAREAIEADELKPAPSDNELVPRKRFVRWAWDMGYKNLPEPLLRLIGKEKKQPNGKPPSSQNTSKMHDDIALKHTDAPFCLAISQDGTSELNQQEYETARDHYKSYNLFLDAVTPIETSRYLAGTDRVGRGYDSPILSQRETYLWADLARASSVIKVGDDDYEVLRKLRPKLEKKNPKRGPSFYQQGKGLQRTWGFRPHSSVKFLIMLPLEFKR